MTTKSPPPSTANPPARRPGAGLMPYVVATLATLAMLALRLCLTPWFGDRPVLLWFVLPILISAYLGGKGAGLYCTVLVALGTGLVLLPQLQGFSFSRPVDLAQWLSLCLIGILLSLMTGRMHRALRSLGETEDLFSKSFQMSPDCLMILRMADRTVIRANDALCRLWGCQPAEVIGRPTQEVTAWLDETERVVFMQELEARGEILGREVQQRLRDGRIIPLELSARIVLLGGERCILAVMHDITERRRAEAAIHDLAAIVNSSDDAIIGKNLQSIITSWNPGAEKIFGYAAEEMIGASIMKIIPAERQQEEKLLVAQIARGESVRHFETVRQRKDGVLVDISVSVSPIRNRHGQVIGASKIARDISARKRAEAAMRETNERFSSMFNSSPVATSLTTIPDGRYLDVNDAFLNLFEASREQVIGHTVFDLNTWVDLHQRDALFARLKEAGAVHGFEMTLRTRSGRVIELLWSGVQVVIEGRTCLLGSGLDFTERRIMERALREKEKLLHAADRRLAEIVQGMTEACFALDKDWRFSFVNDRGETLLRQARADMLGRPIWEVFHQLVGTPMEAHYRRTMQERRPVAFEAFSPVAQRWLDVRLFPTPDGLAAFLMDITDRKEADQGLRKSQEEFQDLFDNAPLGYHEVDLEGRIVRMNGTELKMLGYSREELLGRHVWTLLENPEESRAATLAKLAGATPPLQFERRFRCKDGTILPVLVQDRMLRDESGAIRGSRAAIQDITELKRVEDAIRQLNAELEQRVEDRTAQLQAANQELEAFTYSVSHDLRTPLRAVDGFSQAVLEDCTPLLPPDGQRHLRTIRESAQRMGELIDDLLAFSRLSRQSLHLQTVDTEKLVRSALADLQTHHAGRQITFQLGSLPPSEGDPALLKQVWLNLLANAVKYTRRRPEAVVEIGCRDEAGEKVFFVRDNGTGFDMKYAHKLFGVFQRLHRAEDYEGTGVGLAIVQRVIHRHGGRVWAQSVPEQGATFFFTLNPPSNP